jgi:hypothetical protein
MTPERQQAILDDLYSDRDVAKAMASMTDEELTERSRNRGDRPGRMDRGNAGETGRSEDRGVAADHRRPEHE